MATTNRSGVDSSDATCSGQLDIMSLIGTLGGIYRDRHTRLGDRRLLTQPGLRRRLPTPPRRHRRRCAAHAHPWAHVDPAMNDMPFLDHSAAYAYRPTEVGARPSPRHAHTFSSRDNSQRVHLHKLSRRSPRRVTPNGPAADPHNTRGPTRLQDPALTIRGSLAVRTPHHPKSPHPSPRSRPSAAQLRHVT